MGRGCTRGAHTIMHICMHTYIQTYATPERWAEDAHVVRTHAHMHTCIHTDIHAYIQVRTSQLLSSTLAESGSTPWHVATIDHAMRRVRSYTYRTYPIRISTSTSTCTWSDMHACGDHRPHALRRVRSSPPRSSLPLPLPRPDPDSSHPSLTLFILTLAPRPPSHDTPFTLTLPLTLTHTLTSHLSPLTSHLSPSPPKHPQSPSPSASPSASASPPSP